MFNNTVYKCELLSVTPDIKVYTDKSMKSNVMNADTTVVNTILVQKTFNPSYFKEIVTGRLIPIYRVITYDTNTVLNGKVELDPPKSPCFIKYNMTVGDEGLILEDDLVKATADEVQEYAFKYIDKDIYSQNLYEIFCKGMKYYDDAKAKGEISGESRIKKFLKAIKITRKI